MKPPKHTCLYYSRGPHFTRTVRRVRHDFPRDRITVIVPPGFEKRGLAQVERGTSEDGPVPLFPVPPLQFLPIEKANGPAVAWRQLRVIRKARYDRIAIMFDSPKLRLLAALSGAPERWCYSVEGRRFPLKRAIVATLFGTLWRHLRGRLRYGRIRCVVKHCPVKRGRD